MSKIDNQQEMIMVKWLGLNIDIAQNAKSLIDLLENTNRERKQRRWWTRDWLLRRTIHRQYEALVAEIKLENPEEFKNFVRVDVQMFQELLNVLGERITKKRTWSRQTIDPGMRLQSH